MKKKVLVFPCGSEIGLEIYKSLGSVRDIEIIGASSVNDHGRFVYKNYIPNIPFVEDDSFIETIKRIVTESNIDYIFPAHDSVVLKLAEHSEEISAAILTSPVETCRIARSKSKTYKALSDVIATPTIYSSIQDVALPAFAKPDVGQGSKGTKRIDTPRDAQEVLDARKDLLLLEYLPGEEYTVDCFTDSRGELRYAQARMRTRVLNGISVNSSPVGGKEFSDIAQSINQSLEFRGAWFFQVKRNKAGELALLEVAPRIAGAMAVSRARGVNLPLVCIRDREGTQIDISANTYNVTVDRALGESYELDVKYESVYIDIDVMCRDGEVEPLVMLFLYQCRNEGKQVYVLSDNKELTSQKLTEGNVPSSLFKGIIGLSDKERVVPDRGVIVICDEQYQMDLKKTGVPVFDMSNIETLIRR